MGLDQALVVEHRLGGGGRNRLGRARDVDDDAAGRERPRADRGGMIVAGPDDHPAEW